ncbi:MAG: hypothetical protein AAGE90_05490 [Pseudomonadota bacterium]
MGNAQSEGSGRLGLVIECGLHEIETFEDLDRVPEGLFPIRSKNERPLSSVEQFATQAAFEPLYRSGHSRLRHADAIRRGLYRSQGGNGLEDHQVSTLQRHEAGLRALDVTEPLTPPIIQRGPEAGGSFGVFATR